MFTDHYKQIISILSLSVLCACAKENINQNKPVQVSLKESGDCLTTISDKMIRFKKGELSDSQVASFWSCMQTAVSDYQRLTAGDQPDGSYTPFAIRRFLQRYFFKTQAIDDQLLLNLMEMKRVLLGGSSQSVGREEIMKLLDLFELLKNISLDLNPHMRLIFAPAENEPVTDIRRAGLAVEVALQKIGKWLGQRNEEYTFSQMQALARSLGDDSFVATLASAKQILLSGPADRVLGREWGPLCEALGKGGHGLVVLLSAFQSDLNSVLSGESVPYAGRLLVEVLKNANQRHLERRIPLSEWHGLFLAVEQAGWIGQPFTADNMSQALQWFIDRTLAQGKSAPAEALSAEHLGTMERVFSDWSMLLKAAHGEGNWDGVVGNRFQQMLGAGLPQEWDSKGRMAFSENPPLAWSSEAKIRMVWPFIIMSWLKDAFVSQEVTELTEEQMGEAGLEILRVMRLFGWLTTTNDSIGKQLLREGDLFTLASNGNGRIDLFEASRYLAFIASSFRSAEIWLNLAQEHCGNREAACVRRLGADLSQDVLSSMPLLKIWLGKKDSEKKFTNYVKSAEEVILGKVVKGEFATADLLQVWMIFQYVETFLRRYDLDHSGTVNLRESESAFVVFGPILGKMLASVGLPPQEVFGFFTFMMKYGDTPFTLFGGQILYNHWTWHPQEWAFESERNHLMGILNQLSKL